MEKFLVLSSSNKCENMFKTLCSEWYKKPHDVKKCGQLIDMTLRISILQTDFPPIAESKMYDTCLCEDLKMIRNVLEIAVEYSVINRDIPSFERYISLLRIFYYDLKYIDESSEPYKMLGLYLLYLLAVNRFADFHIELELLPADIIQNNQFICPILGLEQYIREGRYHKIFEAKSCPDGIYNYFFEMLLVNVRNEIATCIENAYDKISMVEAAKRLKLNSLDEMRAFGKKRNWRTVGDDIRAVCICMSSGCYDFTNKVNPKEPFPTADIAEQVLSYACDLEKIV